MMSFVQDPSYRKTCSTCLFGSRGLWLLIVTLKKCTYKWKLRRVAVHIFGYYGGTLTQVVNGVFASSAVLFLGKNSASMELQFIVQENSRKHQEEYPLAAETVLKSTCMDYSLDSVETVEDGIQLHRQLDSLWGIAGMQARKCISNAPEVVAATPKAERATELQISEGQEPVVKTLGVSWNSLGDTFTITTAKLSAELHLIKQNVLRKIATIFESQDSSSRSMVERICLGRCYPGECVGAQVFARA